MKHKHLIFFITTISLSCLLIVVTLQKTNSNKKNKATNDVTETTIEESTLELGFPEMNPKMRKIRGETPKQKYLREKEEEERKKREMNNMYVKPI